MPMRLRATVLHFFLLSTLLVPGSATTQGSGGALHSTDPREVKRQAQMLLKQEEGGLLVQLLDSGPDIDLQAGRDPWQVDSSEPDLAQPLRARPADIEGRWKASAASAPSAVIRRMDDNLYGLEIQTGGCLGHWKLQRKVRYESGILTLDFPAMEYPTKRFQRLFIIEISGEQFLLPSADVDRYLALLAGKGTDRVRTLTWYASWWMKRQTGEKP
jgi:hypothetical protein